MNETIKKAIRNGVSSILVSLMLTCMVSLVFFDIMQQVLSKENLTKSIKQFNISEILIANLEQYEGYLNEYGNSTNVLDSTRLSATSFSEKDMNEILGSEEYADLISDYVLEGGLHNFEDEYKGVDAKELLKEVSDEDIRGLLDEIGVSYNEADMEYLTNTIPAVAPTVMEQVGDNITPNSSNFNFGIFSNIFSDELINMGWIFLIALIVGVVIMYREKCYFSLILAILTGTMCIGIKVVQKIINKAIGSIPDEYMSTVEIFSKPLDNCLNKDFRIFIIATILFVSFYVVMNFVVSKTSIGSSINFLHLANGLVDDEENDELNMEDDFSDIDLSSIKVTDIDKEIDDFF